MGPAIRQPYHHARIGNQLGDPLLSSIEERHRVLDLQIVLNRQIQEGIESILAPLPGDLSHGLPFEGLHRRVADFLHLYALPLALEHLRRL